MKRRQKPILLITVLVICFGLVFIMTSAQNQKPSDTPPPGTSPAPPSGKNTPVPDKKDIASQVSQNIGGAGHMIPSKGPKGRNMPGMPGMKIPDNPSILTDRTTYAGPAPSDTNVNAGWYSSEAPSSYAPPKKH